MVSGTDPQTLLGRQVRLERSQTLILNRFGAKLAERALAEDNNEDLFSDIYIIKEQSFIAIKLKSGLQRYFPRRRRFFLALLKKTRKIRDSLKKKHGASHVFLSQPWAKTTSF